MNIGTFSIHHRDGSARTGELHTAHGVIPTPIFMPVGTQGTVKAVCPEDLKTLGARIILGNTYHLYLRPGDEMIARRGGLHRFMNWDRPILTDSGGFQVFSLSGLRKLSEDGVAFSSHIDGSKHFFTPEKVVSIQRNLGSDIMMVLDECVPYGADYQYTKNSLGLTTRWAARCREAYPQGTGDQLLFGIGQGGFFKDLREESIRQLLDIPFDGYALGGLSVGESKPEMMDILYHSAPLLPADKPRYLMGVGTPLDIVRGIDAGIDMFDCVMPTRNARNGMLFTAEGTMNMRNKKWENDFSPIDENGTSFVDKIYSKAYLRHLTIAGEMLGAQIASIHNLAFYVELMSQARIKITNGTFSSWKKEMVEKLNTRL